MIALLLAAAVHGPFATALENRARTGEVEVAGPARDLVLALGQGGETRIEGTLLDGERRRLLVPFAARGAGEPGVVPRIDWPADDPERANGSARFLGWSDDASRLERLPPGLRSRPRPPAGPVEIALPLAAMLLLPASFLLALLARERRAASLLVSLAGAGLVLALAARHRGAAGTGISVLELAEGSDLALEVRASFAAASVEAVDLASTALEVEPEGARVVWIGSFEPGSPWRARSANSALYLLMVRDRGKPPSLAETWVREDGEWTARGAWAAGTPLPQPTSGPPPPGWLSSGLPQGVTVVLGRLERSGDGLEESWIRSTGLP